MVVLDSFSDSFSTILNTHKSAPPRHCAMALKQHCAPLSWRHSWRFFVFDIPVVRLHCPFVPIADFGNVTFLFKFVQLPL